MDEEVVDWVLGAMTSSFFFTYLRYTHLEAHVGCGVETRFYFRQNSTLQCLRARAESANILHSYHHIVILYSITYQINDL